MDQGFVNTKQEQFYTTYIVPKKVDGGTGDITDGALIMTGTPNGTQVTWTFALKIVPSPLVGGATGTIEFTYTL